MQKIFFGNLPFTVSETEFRDFVEAESGVNDLLKVEFMRERDTNKFRGFAFVSVDDKNAAAVLGINGVKLDGRKLTVNTARPKVETR